MGYEFAGRLLAEPLPGGTLYRCPGCELYFRHPTVSNDVLDSLYIAGALDSWQSGPATRTDWSLAKSFIRSRENIKTILDVGCFDGGFLEHLGTEYVNAGIEIHPAAREAAEKRGITIVGHNLSDLENLDSKYDCVTAIDVIEHIKDPGSLLKSLARVTCPGGIIVISTGDSFARSWRVMGAMYWYCAIPEHIAFINPAWCERAASQMGLRIIHIEHFSHEPLPPLASLTHAAANVLYRYAPSIAFPLRRIYARMFGKPVQPWHNLPPPWRCARDHFITGFQK